MMQQLKTLSRIVLNRYPPTNYQVLGIGRSPALLIAALKEHINRTIIVYTIVGKTRRTSVLNDLITDLKELGYFEKTEFFTSFTPEKYLAEVISNRDDHFAVSEFSSYDLTSEENVNEPSPAYQRLIEYLRHQFRPL